MRDKLKRALEKYEKRRPIATDEELTCAVEQIIEKERSKKLRRRDSTLIDEAISFLFELRGLDTEAIDEAGEEANRAALSRAFEREEEARPTHLWKRFLVPVAILLSVIIATSVAIGYEKPYELDAARRDAAELMQDLRGTSGAHLKTEKQEIYSGTEVDRDIKTLDELTEVVEETNVYLPYGLEEDYEIGDIYYIDFGEYKEIRMHIYDENNGDDKLIIETRETWQVEFETRRIGKFDVCFTKYKDDNRNDVYYAAFQYDGCTYNIYACSVWRLGRILNNLEVIKK